MALKSFGLKISGMTCQGCADTISRYLRKEKGVAQVSIDWEAGSAMVVIDPDVISEEEILHNSAFEGHYSVELAE